MTYEPDAAAGASAHAGSERPQAGALLRRRSEGLAIAFGGACFAGLQVSVAYAEAASSPGAVFRVADLLAATWLVVAAGVLAAHGRAFGAGTRTWRAALKVATAVALTLVAASLVATYYTPPAGTTLSSYEGLLFVGIFLVIAPLVGNALPMESVRRRSQFLLGVLALVVVAALVRARLDPGVGTPLGTLVLLVGAAAAGVVVMTRR